MTQKINPPNLRQAKSCRYCFYARDKQEGSAKCVEYGYHEVSWDFICDSFVPKEEDFGEILNDYSED